MVTPQTICVKNAYTILIILYTINNALWLLFIFMHSAHTKTKWEFPNQND